MRSASTTSSARPRPRSAPISSSSSSSSVASSSWRLADDAGDALGQTLRRARQPALAAAERASAASSLAHAGIADERRRRGVATMRIGAIAADAATPANAHRRVMLAAAEAVALDQHLRRRCRRGAASARASRCRARLAQPRRARSRTISPRHLRHARRRRAGPRAERKDVEIVERRLLDESAACRANIAVVSRSGSRRSDRRRARCRAASRARARQTASASARGWRRFMRFRIRSSPAWSERCRCGISRGSSAISRQSIVVDLDRIERRQAQPRAAPAPARATVAAQLAEARPARQIAP